MFSSSLLGLSLDALSNATEHPMFSPEPSSKRTRIILKSHNYKLTAFLDILQRAINPRKDTFCVSRVKPLPLQHTIFYMVI